MSKIKRIFYLSFALLLCALTHAQIVTTIPEIPKEDLPLEIIFDAKLSSGGLARYAKQDVYAHTGVITDKSHTSADWRYAPQWLDNAEKYKLVSLGDRRWKLTLPGSIRQYYGVPEGERILQMAFVFRNGDGTVEGKRMDHGDIFVKVYGEERSVTFTSPTSYQLVAPNSAITFTGTSSEAAPIRILVNGVVQDSVSSSHTLTKRLTFEREGASWVVVEAGSGSQMVRDSLYVNVKKPVEEAPRPEWLRPGVTISEKLSAAFLLYAPGKSSVYLIGEFNDWLPHNEYMLKRDGDYWWIILQPLKPRLQVSFQYLVDGELKIADPYSDMLLDPWHDREITEQVYPDLKPYPHGKTEGIVSVLQTAQALYPWKIHSFKPPEKEQMVIYELLIRDFTKEHTFASTMQKLDYLQTLGVNVIQLMPINEFEGNESWGYNPSFYFAVDKYYGDKNSFKAFVDECHRRGMAVVIDMVLNHTYGQSPFLRLYWNGNKQAPSADNPWYNVTSPNQTYHWGYDLNHESPHTQALVDSINSYWISEYKVDGFRFDFTKGFTNSPGDGWSYDQGRIDLLKRMTQEIYRRKSDAIVILEHLTENSEEKVLAEAGMMLWGNMNGSYKEAIKGRKQHDLKGGLSTARGWGRPHLVSYMESHDEERLLYEALHAGEIGVKGEQAMALQRAGLCAAFHLLLPGPKMIWQFGELGYDHSINRCPDGTIRSDCRLSPKPIPWEYMEVEQRKALYDLYAKLIRLKKEDALFSTPTITYSLEGAEKSFVWTNGERTAFLVGNFGLTEASLTLTLPKAGRWVDLIHDTSLELSSATYSELLQPGEFRLYVDHPYQVGIDAMPEPSSPMVSISPQRIILNHAYTRVAVYDLQGKSCLRGSNISVVPIRQLCPGLYLLQLEDGDQGVRVLKFIK